MTTRTQVNNAFKKLQDAGYFAEQNFWCCQSCGWNAIEEGVEKVVFYHEQDAEAWNEDISVMQALALMVLILGSVGLVVGVALYLAMNWSQK